MKRWLTKFVSTVAIALAPIGGEVIGEWVLIAAYVLLLRFADPPSLILYSWGVKASISLLVLAASVTALAALLFSDNIITALRSVAGLVVVAGAVPAMIAVFVAFFGLPAKNIGDAYAIALVAHLTILAFAVPLATITAVIGGVRGFTDVAFAFIAGVLSLFTSILLGYFLMRSATGDYVSLASIVGIYEPNIWVVGPQMIMYEVFLLFTVGAAYGR